jgi:hypothetical protein
MPLTIRSLGRFVDEHLGVSDDRAEDVVEVVRNAGREATDGIHFLGLAQLLFHSRAANATYVRQRPPQRHVGRAIEVAWPIVYVEHDHRFSSHPTHEHRACSTTPRARR